MKFVGRAVAETARKRRVRSFMVDFGYIRNCESVEAVVN